MPGTRAGCSGCCLEVGGAQRACGCAGVRGLGVCGSAVSSGRGRGPEAAGRGALSSAASPCRCRGPGVTALHTAGPGAAGRHRGRSSEETGAAPSLAQAENSLLNSWWCAGWVGEGCSRAACRQQPLLPVLAGRTQTLAAGTSAVALKPADKTALEGTGPSCLASGFPYCFAGCQ